MAIVAAVLPSALKTASASSSLSFGAESRGPPRSLSTLRSSGRPETTQDSLAERLPAARRDCPPGGSFRGLSRFSSQLIASSSQAFLAQPRPR